MIRPRLLMVLASLTLSTKAVEAQTPRITDGRQLIRAMHERYAGRWFRTVTFVQDNVHYRPDGTIENRSKWDHYFSLPGTLRIDYQPRSDGNGIVLANDTQYVFQGGKLQSRNPRVLSLLLLAFDAYVLPPETTITQAERLGFDLSKLAADQWQGRSVFVVGGPVSSPPVHQFWVDQEHLYVVRVIESVGATQVRDVQFNKYQRLGGGWIAPEVMMYLDGKPQRLEEYRELKGDVPVDPKLFNPGAR